MPLLRNTSLPALTAPLQVDVPALYDGETAYTLVTLIGTVLQDFPWGSPVHVDPYLAPIPPAGGATGPLLLGGSLLPGSQLRLLWTGPSDEGLAQIRVTVFPAVQVD